MKDGRFCGICGDNLQALLLKASHMYFAMNYEQLTAKGMHPGQMPMLNLLARRGGMSQREIARELHVKPPSVAVSIRRLENAGLVVRAADGKDQRISRISLSPKGEKMLEDIQGIFEQNDKLLFRGFNETEECLLRRFLIQIIENMADVQSRQIGMEMEGIKDKC